MLGVLLVVLYYVDFFDRPFMPQIFENNTRSLFFYVIGGGFLVMAIVEVLRFKFDSVQRLFLKLFGPLLKAKEVDQIHASIPFFLACALCFGFMPKEVAILSVLFLVIGDPAAAWVGGRYGKKRFSNGKSVEGFAGGIAAASLAGFLFLALHLVFITSGFMAGASKNGGGVLPGFESFQFLALGMIVAGAIAAFVAELWSGDGMLDDNLLIPLSASAAMLIYHWLVFGSQLSALIYPWQKLAIPVGAG